MGNKRSKKKRDAARRAAEEAADKMDGNPNTPIGTAQEKRESACGEAEHQLHYDEILRLAQFATSYFARAEPLGTSDELRVQGNDKYTSIHDGLPPAILAARMQASIDLYTKAVDTATTAEQMASASKNLGFAHRKSAYMEGSFPVRMRHLCISARHLCNAYVFGAACKPAPWGASVAEDAMGCIDAVKDALSECRIKQRLRMGVLH